MPTTPSSKKYKRASKDKGNSNVSKLKTRGLVSSLARLYSII
jgi:hypothetical protein